MEPFIGMIVQFGGNFAPRGWALCDGQLLAINSHSALFSILGTTYGGDGRSTFGLPDLRGRVAVHAGTGPGLTPRQLGHKSGAESVTLTIGQMPNHTHRVSVLNGASTSMSGDDEYFAQGPVYTPKPTPAVEMNQGALSSAGGGQPTALMQPFQVVNFIIALQGTYPSRS